MLTALKTLWQAPRWMACVFGVGFALIYLLTAAPDVQAGDSAEFQLAAVVGGVPHPTTYPLYTLLSATMVNVWPVGTAAWRVTLLSVFLVGLFGGVHCASMCGGLVSVMAGSAGRGRSCAPALTTSSAPG